MEASRQIVMATVRRLLRLHARLDFRCGKPRWHGSPRHGNGGFCSFSAYDLWAAEDDAVHYVVSVHDDSLTLEGAWNLAKWTPKIYVLTVREGMIVNEWFLKPVGDRFVKA